MLVKNVNFTWFCFEVELCGIGEMCNRWMTDRGADSKAKGGRKVGHSGGRWTGLWQLEACEDGLWRTGTGTAAAKLKKKEIQN
jgi:hypothetical protein